MDKKKEMIGTFIGGLIFLIAGLCILCIFMVRIYNYISSAKWKETPCKIISSKITVKEEYNKESRNYVKYYYPHITYSYEFNGRNYTSTAISFSINQDGRAYTALYPEGKQAICYVNPSSPEKAILERKFNILEMIGFIILSAIFITLGIFISLWAKKRLNVN